MRLYRQSPGRVAHAVGLCSLAVILAAEWRSQSIRYEWAITGRCARRFDTDDASYSHDDD